MKRAWLVICALLVPTWSFASFTPDPVFENVNAAQTIDLSGSYCKQSVQLTIKNIGESPQSKYYYGIDQSLLDKLSMIEGRLANADNMLKVMDTPLINEETGLQWYEVSLISALAPGDEIDIIIAQVVTDQLKPLPEFGEQTGSQYMTYHGNRYFVSPYETKSSETIIVTVGSDFNDLDEGDDEMGRKEGNVIHYGPYKNIEPFESRSLSVRYGNPAPLAKVTKLEREIWISHWGASLSVEETFWLTNIGTKLRGSFSRLDYRKGFNAFNLNYAAIKEIVFGLRPDAREVYYTDLVGNVSTSNFRPESQGALLSVRPRYPIFGGWNYNFTVGWTYDLGNFLKDVGNEKYALRVPLIEGPRDVTYDKVIVRIIFPEGANDIQSFSPLPIDTVMSSTYSFLDTIGRPTMSLEFDNLFDGHAKADILVEYSYSWMAAMKKPVSITVGLFAVFASILILSNVNINISSKEKIAKSKKN